MSGINNFAPGYIDKENEVIFGLQTDAPLKRIVNPYGGIRLVEKELEVYNYHMDDTLMRHFKDSVVVIMMVFLPPMTLR